MADEAAGFDDLEAWAAGARAREAAEARVRERWLRTQAAESAVLVEVLAGLAEQEAAVTLSTAAGSTVAGRLVRVGRDFVAVETAAGHTALVALAALAWCRASGAGRRAEPAVATGAVGGVHDRATSLADVLAQAAGRRPGVVVHTAGGRLSGELRAVGVDVIVLDTPPRGLAYVRLPSVSDISFLDSG